MYNHGNRVFKRIVPNVPGLPNRDDWWPHPRFHHCKVSSLFRQQRNHTLIVSHSAASPFVDTFIDNYSLRHTFVLLPIRLLMFLRAVPHLPTSAASIGG